MDLFFSHVFEKFADYLMFLKFYWQDWFITLYLKQTKLAESQMIMLKWKSSKPSTDVYVKYTL